MSEQDGFRRSAAQLGLLLLAIAGAVAVLVTGKGPKDVLEQRRAALPQSKDECVSASGEWRQTTFGGEYCSLSLKDAGKPCDEIQDCQGVCLAASSMHNPFPHNACSSELVLFGCFAEYNHGVEQICRD
jgi:hypothetical protein